MSDKMITYSAIFVLGVMMLVFIACARQYMTNKQFKQYQMDIKQEQND